MHLSHLTEDLEAWYVNFEFAERVTDRVSPGAPRPRPRAGGAPGPEAGLECRRRAALSSRERADRPQRLDPDDIPARRRRQGPRRHALPGGHRVPIRADFNTLDNPFLFSSTAARLPGRPRCRAALRRLQSLRATTSTATGSRWTGVIPGREAPAAGALSGARVQLDPHHHPPPELPRPAPSAPKLSAGGAVRDRVVPFRVGSLVVAIVVLAMLSGCGGHKASHGIAELDPGNLPSLPAQGLVVDRAGGVLLEGLDGKVLGRVPGYRTFPPGSLRARAFVRSVGIGALTTAAEGLVVLYDRTGRGWILDPAKSALDPIGSLAVPLAAGARLVVHVTGTASKGVGATTAVVRDGKTLLAGYLSVTGGRYVSSSEQGSSRRGVLLDVVTGRRWRLGAGCTVAGIVAGRAIAACQAPSGNVGRRGGVYSIAADGSRRVLATFAPGLYPESAWLSPDSRWVLLYLSPGCGPGWAAVMPASGGAPHYVAGGTAVPSSGPTPAARFSSALGWTSDGKVVATIAGSSPSSCEHESHSGTFLIDPATLAKTRATTAVAAMLWGGTGS